MARAVNDCWPQTSNTSTVEEQDAPRRRPMTRSYPTGEAASTRALLDPLGLPLAASVSVDSAPWKENVPATRDLLVFCSGVEAMSVRKGALSRLAFLVFPLALLLVYWENTYFDGHPFDQTIHLTTTARSRGAARARSAIPLREKSVSQEKSWSLRDIPSTTVNVFITGTVWGARCSCRLSCSSPS